MTGTIYDAMAHGLANIQPASKVWDYNPGRDRHHIVISSDQGDDPREVFVTGKMAIIMDSAEDLTAHLARWHRKGRE